MKHSFIITAALLLAAVGLSAQNKSTGNKSAGINLSLWKEVTTQPLDSSQTTYLNIGLQSTVNRVNGAAFNILGGVVRQNMNGLQTTGLVNIVGGSMRGVQLSGISNVNGNNLAGLSATGLVNIAGNNAQGVLLSGFTNITGDNARGIIASGLMNITGNEVLGIQLAGISNITASTFDGLMAAGLLNIVGSTLNGVQLSGLFNIIGKQLNGVQLSLFNYASKAKGVQLGLVNYYKDEMKGVQLGLVNANPETKVQMMLFGGNATKLNLAARFKNDLFYTIVGGGSHYLDFSDQFSAALFYRAGLWLPLYKSLTLSGDLGYQHIETFKNKDQGIPARLYALQARINLELQITKNFGVFATGGYGGSRYYNRNATYEKGVIVEAGVVLF